MKMLFLCVVLSIALVTAEEAEQNSRSIILPGSRVQNCGWQLTNNPCNNNALNRLNFPHPSDPTKFLQCGTFNRMFVVQCPVGEIYDQATTACVKKQVAVVSKPLVNPLSQYGMANPCTAQNILVGRIYFSIPNNKGSFIECDMAGNAKVLTCPSKTIWDQNRQSCVYATQNGVVVGGGAVAGTGTGTLTGLLSTGNPCTAQATHTNALFFSHPDPSKFIQCDLQGNAFVQSCPAGLVWNQFLETCASQLATYTLGNQSG